MYVVEGVVCIGVGVVATARATETFVVSEAVIDPSSSFIAETVKTADVGDEPVIDAMSVIWWSALV